MNPLKQGLKRYKKGGEKRYICGVKEVNPLKQGLKHSSLLKQKLSGEVC